MLDARDYQEKALTAIETAEREGVRRPLVVHPTGTGKTVTFSHAINRRADRGRALVLVHRKELADQAIKKLGIVAPELRTGLVKAASNQLDADIVVASVPTVSQDGRLAQLLAAHKDRPFGTIIADEAHHAPAPSWTKVLTAMGSFNPYGPLTIGFTATPERDNKTLGVWEKVVSFMSIREAMFRGFLCPILPAEVVETRMDMTKVGRGADGDLSSGGLGRELEASGAIDQMADAVLEHAQHRKGVAFLPTVRTSQLLAAELVKRGIVAEHLDGATPEDERDAILGRLKTGETSWVTNCAVLTEGFDEPTIDCVLVGRPTKFHGLYVQMIGRGTRNALGKKDLLIIDVVGASQRHELIGVVDLGLELDDKRKKREGEPERQACPSCGGADCVRHRCQLCHRFLPAEDVQAGMIRHETCQASGRAKVDVFGASRLAWLPVGDAWVLGAGKDVMVMVPNGIDVWSLAKYGENKLTVLHDEIPQDWAMGIGEDHAKAFLPLAQRGKAWRNLRMSDAQRGRLVREGLPEKHLSRIRTAGEATDLMVRIQGRRALRRMGVSSS